MNKQQTLSLLTFCGLIVVLLGGCASTSPPIAYYSLSGSQPAPVKPDQRHFAVQIGPVTLPDLLKRSQIVLGAPEQPYRLSDQHRWAGELDREFARALGEQVAAQLGTEQIALFPADGHLQLTDQVLLDILSLEGSLGKEAVLIVRWTVVDPATKAARLTRRSSCITVPGDGSHGAWVAAQRANIGKLGAEVASVLKALH